jgi:rare lipoprotein A
VLDTNQGIGNKQTTGKFDKSYLLLIMGSRRLFRQPKEARVALSRRKFKYLFLIGFCGAQALSSLASAHQTAVGTASFYAERFHGRKTASGERYNMHDLTAATVHSRYPLGSILRVTNLGNDRSVEVRVNDRGPLPRGRVLDLSKRAATELGFLHAGLARVRVEVLRWGRSESGNEPS